MERRAITVCGIVQGVGFRPFVHELASRHALGGFVRNQSGGVLIEIEGETSTLDCFCEALAREPPPLAEINDLTWERLHPCGQRDFRIEASTVESSHAVFILPDVATCDDCLAELFDPRDRRFGYPFINCTNCGPRLTIVTGAPYDRQRTTMAGFVMCARCRDEYDDPVNRRFHAEPTCCPACGPRLMLRDAAGSTIPRGEPIADFAAAILAGQIGALKGLGGFHLVCDARSDRAVGELRRRKQRDERPFALMVRDIDAARVLCEVAPEERELLISKRRPIVLARKRGSAPVAESVAPKNPFLGIMLPYTPLHHLLVRACDGIPLVMTSGNRSDEPIAYEDDDAIGRLSGIADIFLTHNRPIHVRCDDSVTRVVAGHELPMRRSRGYAPHPIILPVECSRPILAVGGQLKGTFALGIGRHAFLSHHLGDLDHFEAYRAFERDIALYEQLFETEPGLIVHDLHPDYASTRYAIERAGASGLELLAIQHHHAHMASCMAEHGLDEPVIAVTFDGTGFGTDGAIWGGEFLVGDYRQFRRAAHLRYVAMPGGDAAIREPWRMAAAHVRDAGCCLPLLRGRISASSWNAVERMLERGINAPPTSSVGRLFDAVASMVGVRDRVTHEGQAAMELEWIASSVSPDGTCPFDLREIHEPASADPVIEVDTRPLIRAIAADIRAGTAPTLIARRFHATLAEVIATVCVRLRAATGLGAVILSGGVFMNALLTEETVQRLAIDGFRVYRHVRVPPNDGSLSLGQLAIAAARSIVTG
jgi:hydrogenase maturation protein HypF